MIICKPFLRILIKWERCFVICQLPKTFDENGNTEMPRFLPHLPHAMLIMHHYNCERMHATFTWYKLSWTKCASFIMVGWNATWGKPRWGHHKCNAKHTLIARFMGPTWAPPGSCRPQMGPSRPHGDLGIWENAYKDANCTHACIPVKSHER